MRPCSSRRWRCRRRRAALAGRCPGGACAAGGVLGPVPAAWHLGRPCTQCECGYQFDRDGGARGPCAPCASGVRCTTSRAAALAGGPAGQRAPHARVTPPALIALTTKPNTCPRGTRTPCCVNHLHISSTVVVVAPVCARPSALEALCASTYPHHRSPSSQPPPVPLTRQQSPSMQPPQNPRRCLTTATRATPRRSRSISEGSRSTRQKARMMTSAHQRSGMISPWQVHVEVINLPSAHRESAVWRLEPAQLTAHFVSKSQFSDLKRIDRFLGVLIARHQTTGLRPDSAGMACL